MFLNKTIDMNAKSIKGNSTAAIKAALKDRIADGFIPTLAFVFITNIEDVEAMSEMLDKEGIVIYGASTGQKFTEEGIEADGIVVLLLDIKTDCFRIVLNDYQTTSPYETARQTGKTGVQTFKNPGFIISPVDFRIPGEDIIKGLMNSAGHHTTIIGGVAGEPDNFTGIVFTNDSSSTSGLLALIIDHDKISINGLAVSGWKPAGIEKKITKSDGSWVYTIDNEPAMNVIKKYLGNEISINKPTEGLVRLDSTYPLQLQRASGTPIMKPVLLWNTANNSVMVGGQVKEGQQFRFSLPPDFEVIDTVVESTRMVKEKNMPDADALIVFSCAGRLESLGPMSTVEIERLAEIWDKPMIGFFSLGEFGKLDDGQCEFHGTTVSWVALKEK